MKIQELLAAFADRPRPQIFFNQSGSDEICLVDRIALENADAGFPDNYLKKHFDVFSWLTPTAYVYLMPYALCKIPSVGNNLPGLLLLNSIVGLPECIQEWNSFARERWTLLNKSELTAIQTFVKHLRERGLLSVEVFDNESFASCMRALAVLVKEREKGSVVSD